MCRLQLRMSRDVPGDGFYLSGVGSFAGRTCYANSSGDHLVRMLPLNHAHIPPAGTFLTSNYLAAILVAEQ